jgi:hypothetical protein
VLEVTCFCFCLPVPKPNSQIHKIRPSAATSSNIKMWALLTSLVVHVRGQVPGYGTPAYPITYQMNRSTVIMPCTSQHLRCGRTALVCFSLHACTALVGIEQLVVHSLTRG